MKTAAAFASLPLGFVLGLSLFFLTGCGPDEEPRPGTSVQCISKDQNGDLKRC